MIMADPYNIDTLDVDCTCPELHKEHHARIAKKRINQQDYSLDMRSTCHLRNM